MIGESVAVPADDTDPHAFSTGHSKCCGWLFPSTTTSVEEVIRVVRKLLLPISALVTEDVQIASARLITPELKESP